MIRRPRKPFQLLATDNPGRLRWPGFVAGGLAALFGTHAVNTGTDVALYGMVAVYGVALAIAVSIAVNLWRMTNNNDRMAGDVCRMAHSWIHRVEGFLFANPWILRNDRVRLALLPNEREMRALRFNQSMVIRYREIRRGDTWVFVSGVRNLADPTLKLHPKRAFARRFRRQIEQLRAQNERLVHQNGNGHGALVEKGDGVHGVEVRS